MNNIGTIPYEEHATFVAIFDLRVLKNVSSNGFVAVQNNFFKR